MNTDVECTKCLQDMGKAISRFLVLQPELDEVAEIVVALLSGCADARGALILCSAEPSIIGSWVSHVPGWPPATTGLESALLDLVSRPGEPHPLHADAEPGDGWTMTAWPLGASNVTTGALVAITPTPVRQEVMTTALSAIADVLSIYVAGTRQMVSRNNDTAPATAERADLTSRQREVLSSLSEGLTMHQIARRMGFSDSIIRAESVNIYRKLGVHDREQAIEVAQQLGLLENEAAQSSSNQ